MENKLYPQSKTVPMELYDVFQVMQLTRGTPLEANVAADWVALAPHQESTVHRHNFSETVLFIVKGSAVANINDRNIEVHEGEQIIIRPGEFHGFKTHAEPLVFISIQTPPILNKKTGMLDLENKGKG